VDELGVVAVFVTSDVAGTITTTSSDTTLFDAVGIFAADEEPINVRRK
jgi:hypothetical protein